MIPNALSMLTKVSLLQGFPQFHPNFKTKSKLYNFLCDCGPSNINIKTFNVYNYVFFNYKPDTDSFTWKWFDPCLNKVLSIHAFVHWKTLDEI